VEDEGLLHTDGMLLALVALGLDYPVLASSLPVSRLGGPVRPATVGVLAVLGGEEEPLGIIGPDQGLIWEVPRLALADVDLGDDLGLGVDPAGDLALEVVGDELLVGGVEAEAERQRPELHHRHLHHRDRGGEGYA